MARGSRPPTCNSLARLLRVIRKQLRGVVQAGGVTDQAASELADTIQSITDALRRIDLRRDSKERAS